MIAYVYVTKCNGNAVNLICVWNRCVAEKYFGVREKWLLFVILFNFKIYIFSIARIHAWYKLHHFLSTVMYITKKHHISGTILDWSTMWQAHHYYSQSNGSISLQDKRDSTNNSTSLSGSLLVYNWHIVIKTPSD